MKRNIRLSHVAATVVALMSLQGNAMAASGTPPAGTSGDESALRAQAQGYAEAFSTGNIQGLTALWAPDGTLTDVRGQEYRGRSEIEQGYKNFFDRFGKQQLEVNVESVRFPTPEIAIEEGTSRLVNSPTPIHQCRYQVVHVKKDGKWLMTSVTETPFVPEDSTNFLKELSWIVGDWTAKGPKGSMKFVASWVANKNFISCSWFANGQQQPSQMEIIGWDPVTKQIASWHFDGVGGHGYASWAKDKNSWIVDGRAVQPGGASGHAEYVFNKVDDNNFTWRSERREINGVELPGTGEITVSRNK